MSQHLELWRIACCGLQSALAVLEHAGLPAPATAEVRVDGPVGRCCSELVVTPTDTRVVYETDQLGNTVLGCGYQTFVTFEVSLGRCISDWFGNDKACNVELGSCNLSCDGLDQWSPPTTCGESTQADEQMLLFADRHALETLLPASWKCCVADHPCDDCPATCASVQLLGSETWCEGGCAGVKLRVEVQL